MDDSGINGVGSGFWVFTTENKSFFVAVGAQELEGFIHLKLGGFIGGGYGVKFRFNFILLFSAIGIQNGFNGLLLKCINLGFPRMEAFQ